MGAVEADEEDKGDGDHQFVGDGVEERAEIGGLLPAAGEIAVEPVGYGGGGEDESCRPVGGLRLHPV